MRFVLAAFLCGSLFDSCSQGFRSGDHAWEPGHIAVTVASSGKMVEPLGKVVEPLDVANSSGMLDRVSGKSDRVSHQLTRPTSLGSSLSKAALNASLKTALSEGSFCGPDPRDVYSLDGVATSSLGLAIAARATAVSGEVLTFEPILSPNSTPSGSSGKVVDVEVETYEDAFIHVKDNLFKQLSTHLEAVEKQHPGLEKHRFQVTPMEETEVRREVYRMVNNQLPLDTRNTPYAISYPVTDEHIQKLIRLALALKWKVYIVGGGHSSDAWGCNQGLVISMLFRRSLRVIDGDAWGWPGQVLQMEAGVIWAEAYAAAHEAKSLLMGGSCATVGVVGYYLGGGYGFLSGFLGFGADNVLQFKAVTAKGDMVVANSVTHVDLFNALRGGGHLGIAAVSEVWVRLHPWDHIGCIFKILLIYDEMPVDMEWFDKLAEESPQRLHVYLRTEPPVRLKVALTYVSEATAFTRCRTALELSMMLEKHNVPFPKGESCADYAGEKSWRMCLLGTDKKPTGIAHCRGDGGMAYQFGDFGDMRYPDSEAMEGDAWGLKRALIQAIAGDSLPNQTLFSDGYAHRASTKSMFLENVRISDAFLRAVDRATTEEYAGSLFGRSYVFISWWGGGNWAPDDGSIADAHRKYAWLVTMSCDFSDRSLDRQAIQWTTKVFDMLSGIDRGPHLPYPNLYDRIHWTESSSQTVRPVTYALGEKGHHQALAAKTRWDGSNVFHMPQ